MFERSGRNKGRGRVGGLGRLASTSVAAGLLALALGATPALAAPGGQSDVAAVRAATAAFHDLAVAQDAG